MIPDLPEGWSARTATADDVDVILPVVHASDIAALGYPDFTADEVRETLAEPRTESWLVFAGPSAVAWGYLSNETGGTRDVIDIYVRPGAGEAAQPPLLAARAVADRVAGPGVRPRHDDRAGRGGADRALVDLGVGGSGVRVREAVRADEGVAAGCGAGGRAGRRLDRAAAVRGRGRAAAVLRDPGRGVPRHAGALQSSDSSADEGEGWVDKLAVLAEYRGRGIGRALLSTAFATYTARGLTAAGLGVDLVNPTGAYALYESVGMRPAYEIDIYESRSQRAGMIADLVRKPFLQRRFPHKICDHASRQPAAVSAERT